MDQVSEILDLFDYEAGNSPLPGDDILNWFEDPGQAERTQKTQGPTYDQESSSSGSLFYNLPLQQESDPLDHEESSEIEKESHGASEMIFSGEIRKKRRIVKQGYNKQTVNFGKVVRNCILKILDELAYANSLTGESLKAAEKYRISKCSNSSKKILFRNELIKTNCLKFFKSPGFAKSLLQSQRMEYSKKMVFLKYAQNMVASIQAMSQGAKRSRWKSKPSNTKRHQKP